MKKILYRMRIFISQSSSGTVFAQGSAGCGTDASANQLQFFQWPPEIKSF